MFFVFFLKRSGCGGGGPLNPRKRKAEARGPPRSPPSFPSSCRLSNQREFLSLWFPTCFRHNLRTRVGGSSGLPRTKEPQVREAQGKRPTAVPPPPASLDPKAGSWREGIAPRKSQPPASPSFLGRKGSTVPGDPA